MATELESKPILRQRDVLALLGISRACLWKWRMAGVFPNPESTEGGRRVSILKWPEGALLNLG